MPTIVREYKPTDAQAVDDIARAAFAEYESCFEEWSSVYEEWSCMSLLDEQGSILVAVDGECIAGAVCLLDSNTPKHKCFEPEWAVLRSLVVSPKVRGRGTGARLTRACITRAMDEGYQTIGLLTSPIMEAAVKLYVKLGFVLHRDYGVRNGIRWVVYTKELDDQTA
ncbi:GNAT family N-acetyltransferase [Candidatus Hydrogenedentota bacterium]